MNNKYKLIITLLTLTSICTNVSARVSKDSSAQRALFLQVEADLKKGKLNSYRKHKNALQSYALYPYLKYRVMHSMIGSLKYSEVGNFISTYHDSPLSDRLRNEWLEKKAKQEQWHQFMQGYDTQAKNSVAMQCNYIQANLATNQDKDIYRYVPHIWLNSKSLPKECDSVFYQWKRDGGLTKNLLWQRIKLSVEDGNQKIARYLAKDLKESDQKIVELWIRTNADPSIISRTHYFTSKHSAIREIIVHGITKIAKRNPSDAVRHWRSLEKKYKFNEHHWGAVVKQIGISLSHRLDINAEKWLSEVPESMQGADISNARLKLAVNENAWSTIAQIYRKLPFEERHSDKWQYWYARALEMLGERDESQKTLVALSRTRNYYGFLASSRVLRPYAFNHENTSASDSALAQIMSTGAIKRAFELKEIGRIHTGKSEWYRALQSMDDKQRIASAHLAADWDMPNWAIVSLANANNKNDLVLRFPQSYADHIHKAAVHNDLDPELLFAITRQESAFIPTAKSPAGALGLMQIMPKTGLMVAKASSESLRHQNELLKPDKNIRLGSKYVRMMLDKYQQNPALATASYNAGPHRVASWLPDYDMPADCWIETIPFKETREYVQNVLTYTVIYQQLLGKDPRMSKYMPIINGKRRKK